MIDIKNAHGGNILAMAGILGCGTEDLIDMSSNLTPLGMVPGLQNELVKRLSEIAFLPETGSETLCRLFAEKYGLHQDQVLAGNGTTEFIYAVPASLGHERALIVEPTYSDYQVASRWAGMKVDLFELHHADGFQLDLRRLREALTGNELVFLCNPNNPTGGMIPSADLVGLAEENQGSSFLIDESYRSFLPDPSVLDYPLPANLYALGSFSKVYGIPGLRLGFLAASRENMTRLAQHREPWGVNRMAQVAGEFLLRDGDGYVDNVVRFLATHRPAFVKELAALPGVEVIPGTSHFILCFLSGAMRADVLCEKMLARKIMIRNCASFYGLDDRFFRLSMQSESKNAICLSALRDIMSGA